MNVLVSGTSRVVNKPIYSQAADKVADLIIVGNHNYEFDLWRFL